MLAARSEQAEQAEKAARLALRDARDVEIIAAVLSGESHKAVTARHGISAAHARRITQQAREAQPSRSKPPRSKPPREPKPQQRRALRIVSNEPADPLTAAERLLGPWRDALPDDRIAVNDGDTIPRPDPPTLFGLFYDGKVNVIAGSPTTGKSYAALAAATDAAKAGRVMWLDAEDSRETFSLRCLQLGCSILTRSDDVTRLNHSDWTTAEPEHIDLAFQWLADGFGPGRLVIDSGTSSGSGDNLDQWRAWKPRHLPDSRHQIGVILIEHVVKDNEQRHDQAAGSRGKLADVTGTHVQIDELEGTGWAAATDETPPRPGGYAIYCTKNKPGGNGWVRGDRLGVLHGEPHDDGTLTLAVVAGGRARSLVDAVAAWVANNPGQTSTAVADAVPGRKRDLTKAVRKAETDGLIIRIDGPNNAKFCYPPDHPNPGAHP